MSDSKATSQEGITEPQGEGANENQSADGSQFTQEEFNRLMAREKRALREKYADYDALKEKAAQLDAIEEAKKSELEKAKEEANGWKAKYEELKADVDRRKAIDASAAEYGVDAAMLARMAGDVEENAKFLAERAEGAPKYPNVRDEGERKASSVSDLEAQIASEKDPAKRVKLRAELIAQTRK